MDGEEDHHAPWSGKEGFSSPAAPVAEHAWFGKGARQSTSLQSPLTATRTSVASLKTPPKLQQGMTWFDHEKLVRDWSIIAEVDAKKKGTLLKLSLEGTYENYKDFLDETRLTGGDGTEYFLKTLRPHFVKGCIQTFLYKFLLLNGCRRGSADFRDWLLRLKLRRDEALSAWMELAPEPLSPEDPHVVLDFQVRFRNEFEERRARRVEELVQINAWLTEEAAQAQATAMIEKEMLLQFKADVDRQNQERQHTHKLSFPCNDFTFALVTLVRGHATGEDGEVLFALEEPGYKVYLAHLRHHQRFLYGYFLQCVNDFEFAVLPTWKI